MKQEKQSIQRILEKITKDVAPVVGPMHKSRRKLVWDLVTSLVEGADATVTDIGRNMPRDIQEKHAIKSSDRALSNPHLQAQVPVFYRAIASRVISIARPVLLVDGTEHRKLGSIRTSVAFSGRSVTIGNHVLGHHSFAKPTVLKEYLQRLQEIIPKGCRPILVVDGGFQGPFFARVRALGWDYVSRLGNHIQLTNDQGESQKVHSLFLKATPTPHSLGLCTLTKKNYAAHVVLYDGRTDKAKNSKKQTGQNRERKRRNKAKEPWALVSSLQNISAKQMVQLYKKRMQIEENFRDDKSHRFGRGLRYARCSSVSRLSVLLVLLALASLLLCLAGLIAEQRNIQRHFQANTVQHRRVLSLLSLGKRFLKRCRDPVLTIEIHSAFLKIRSSDFVGIP